MTTTPNFVTTTPTRFSAIRPDLLPEMAVLEALDSEAIIAARLAKFKELWASYDPPNAAVYDVERLEFDPIVIHEELAAYFELLVRDRVNQACKAVTLALAVGSDLDAIASRYPYGVPRLDRDGDGVADEPDDVYRQRVWLSPNIFSLGGPGQAVFESYVFWALSAPMPAGEGAVKHASAMTVRSTGNVYVTVMAESDLSEEWTTSSDGKVYTLAPGAAPAPTAGQISAVFEYINEPNTARKGLTDVVYVSGPKITNTTIDADVWLFPGVDKATLMGEVCDAVLELVGAIQWLGADLTDLALKGALAQAGVYRVAVKSPAADVVAGINGCVNVTSVRLAYRGTGE